MGEDEDGGMIQENDPNKPKKKKGFMSKVKGLFGGKKQ